MITTTTLIKKWFCTLAFGFLILLAPSQARGGMFLRGLLAAYVAKTLLVPNITSMIMKKKYEKDHKDSLAPEHVQQLADYFLYEMTKGHPLQRLRYLLKKRLSPTKVFVDSKEKYLPKNTRAAFQTNTKGLVFSAGTDFNDTFVRGALCHEMRHVWQNMFPLQWASKLWRTALGSDFRWQYSREYDAENTTMKILYQKGMHSELTTRLIDRLYPQGIRMKNPGTKQNLHPYIHGTVDAFVELLHEHPEDEMLQGLEDKILQAFQWERKKTWREWLTETSSPEKLLADWKLPEGVLADKNTILGRLKSKLKRWKSPAWKQRYREYMAIPRDEEEKTD